MKMSYCPTCRRKTGHQRRLGFGTLFAVLITIGWWLLALPFYPRRCTICGSAESFLPKPQPSTAVPPAADTKICPHCAETIKSAAKKCRFCGELLDAD